jgi:hypothetical protein
MGKKCSKCCLIKPFNEFNKRSNSKDGLRFDCKVCQKAHYEANREHYISKMKENRNSKLDEYIERDKAYYDENRELILKQKKQYHLDNQEIINDKSLTYRKNNKKKISKRNKVWRINNIDYIREYQKNYILKNKGKNKHIIMWRSMLRCSLDRLGKKKEGHTIDLLGYSALELKNHLTSLFTDGMNWDNYGEWHIDHIKDVSSFDKETPMNIVNALSNLQPLWATTREINGVIYEGNLNKRKLRKKKLFHNSLV